MKSLVQMHSQVSNEETKAYLTISFKWKILEQMIKKIRKKKSINQALNQMMNLALKFLRKKMTI